MHEHSYLDSHGHRRMFRPDNLADYLPDDSPGPDELLALPRRRRSAWTKARRCARSRVPIPLPSRRSARS